MTDTVETLIVRFEDRVSAGAKTAADAIRRVGEEAVAAEARLTRAAKSGDQLSRSLGETERLAARVAAATRNYRLALDELDKSELKLADKERARAELTARIEQATQRATQAHQRWLAGLRAMEAPVGGVNAGLAAASAAADRWAGSLAQVYAVSGRVADGVSGAARAIQLLNAGLDAGQSSFAQWTAGARGVEAALKSIGAAQRAVGDQAQQASKATTAASAGTASSGGMSQTVNPQTAGNIEKQGQAFSSAANGAGAFFNALRTLAPQLVDVATKVQNGNSVLEVAIQQGPQLAEGFLSVGRAAAGMRGGFAALGPAGAIVLGVMGLVAARALEISAQTRQFSVMLKAAGQDAVMTGEQVRVAADKIYMAGASRPDATAVIGAAINTRQFSSAAQLEEIGKVSIDLGVKLGGTAEAGKKLVNWLTSGVPGLQAMATETEALSLSQYGAARAALDHGNKLQAQSIMIDAIKSKFAGLERESLDPVQKAFRDLSRAYDDLVSTAATHPITISIAVEISGAMQWLTQFLKDPTKTEFPTLGLKGLLGGETAPLNTNPRQPSEGALTGNQADLSAYPLAPSGTVIPDPKPDSMTEKEARHLYDLRKANDDLLVAMRKVGAEQKIEFARAQTKIAAVQSGKSAPAATAEGDEAARMARAQLNASIAETNTQLSISSQYSLEAANAYLKAGEAAGLYAEALKQGMLDQFSTGVNAEARARQQLAEKAAATALAGAQQVPQLEREAAARLKIADAAMVGVGAQHEAELAYKVEQATLKEKIDLVNANAETENTLREIIARKTQAIKDADEAQNRTVVAQAIQQQKDQLSLGEAQLNLIGASAEQRAVEMARLQAEIYLRNNHIDALSSEGQAYLANSKALALQQLDIERTNQAYQELAQFGERSFDAIANAMMQAKGNTKAWADAVKSIATEFQTLAIRMAVINPLKNIVFGTNLPTIVDLGSLFGSSGTSAKPANQNGISGNLTNLVGNKAGSWALDKLTPGGIGNMVDQLGYNYLGIGTMAPTWMSTAPAYVTGAMGPVQAISGSVSGNAAIGISASGQTGVANTLYSGAANGVPGTGIAGGLSAYLGAAGAGAFGGMVGGYLGTAANSKAVGGLSGAALGAGSAGLYAAIAGWSAIGGPVGLAIGAIVGGVMGLLGTQKKSVGPNSSVVLKYSGTGVEAGNELADNGADASVIRKAADGVAKSVNTIVSGVGARFAGKSGSPLEDMGVIRWFQEGDKWSLEPTDGSGPKQQYGSQEEALSAMIKWTLQRLDATGRISDVKDDVRTALRNTKATKAEDLANDLEFAAGFRANFDAMNAALDPTNNQIKEFTEASRKLGTQVKESITDWKDKAKELGLATEQGLTQAARTGILAMMGLGPAVEPLRGLDAVTKQAEIGFEAFKPALADLGYTATEQADLFARFVARAKTDYEDAVGLTTRAGATTIAQLLYPSARQSGMDRLRQMGLDPKTNSGLTGLGAMLDGIDASARAGTLRFTDMQSALVGLDAALRNGQVTGEHYQTLVTSISSSWQTLQGVVGAQRSGRVAVETAIDPNWRPDVDTQLSELGLSGPAIVALRTVWQTVSDTARSGSLTASTMHQALEGLNAQLTAGQITAEQHKSAVGELTTAWQTSTRTAQEATSFHADVYSRLHAVVGNDRSSQLHALDQQQARELSDARLAGRDVTRLKQVQAGERAQKAFELAQQDVLNWYDREIEAKQELVISLQDGAVKIAQAAQQFKQARDSLAISDEAPISPQERLAEAKRQWDAALATVRSGTASDTELDTARQSLLQLGPTLVNLEKTNSAGTARTLYDEIRRVFGELGDAGALGVDAAERQLQAAEDSLKELQKGRQEAAGFGQRNLGALFDLKSTMESSFNNMVVALGPLQALTGSNPYGALTAAQFGGMVDAATTKDGLDPLVQYAKSKNDSTMLTKAYRRAADLGVYYGNYSYADPIGSPLYQRADQQYADEATAFLRTLGYGGGYNVDANIFLQATGKGDAFTTWLKQYVKTRWGLQEGGIVGAYEAGGIVGNGIWGRDSVLARYAGGGTILLAGGEYVMPAEATASYRPMLDAMRAGEFGRELSPANDRGVPLSLTAIRPATRSAADADAGASVAELRQIKALLARLEPAIHHAEGAAQEQRSAIGSDTNKLLRQQLDEIREQTKRRVA